MYSLAIVRLYIQPLTGNILLLHLIVIKAVSGQREWGRGGRRAVYMLRKHEAVGERARA